VARSVREVATVVEELVEIVAMAIGRAEYCGDRRALVQEDEIREQAPEHEVERCER